MRYSFDWTEIDSCWKCPMHGYFNGKAHCELSDRDIMDSTIPKWCEIREEPECEDGVCPINLEGLNGKSLES